MSPWKDMVKVTGTDRDAPTKVYGVERRKVLSISKCRECPFCQQTNVTVHCPVAMQEVEEEGQPLCGADPSVPDWCPRPILLFQGDKGFEG